MACLVVADALTFKPILNKKPSAGWALAADFRYGQEILYDARPITSNPKVTNTLAAILPVGCWRHCKPVNLD